MDCKQRTLKILAKFFNVHKTLAKLLLDTQLKTTVCVSDSVKAH